MKRISAGTCVALLLLGVLSLVGSSPASAAPAQPDPNACFPGSDADYPPTGPAVQIDVDLTLDGGFFNPGANGHVEISGAELNGIYCGTAYSTPIVLPAKQANAQGKLIYDLAVPKDFELGAMHHIDVFKLQVQVGSFDFCVAKNGVISPNSACVKAPAKSGGALAKTGTNHLLDIVRIALMVLAVGAAVLYGRRRMQSRTA